MKQIKLFSQEKSHDELYSQIRDQNGNIRKYIEDIWKDYELFADQNFDKQLSENFIDHIWEMCLFKALKDKDLEFAEKTRKVGPDFIINTNSRKINIEAVTVSSGEINNKNSIKNNGQISGIDEDFFSGDISPSEIQVRYLKAIYDKKEKIEKYISEKVILETDINIIAITSAKIPITAIPDPVLGPVGYLIRSLSPIGNEYICVNGTSKKVAFEKSNQVFKNNGNPVTKLLINENNLGNISAFLYAPSLSIYNDNFVQPLWLIKNQNCCNPLGDVIDLPEVVITQNLDRFSISYISKQNA
ncbi:hypothetical protein [Spirochaeta lutea]|uniref:Uncharacterized protein n=1 Tax=Spirochaeta lutea TaxID=1480694 RepID=A0A098R0G8_9SPIO|nr:hypothetical protein [Spirochaeta lutea]KGE73660.1 hypothetical protein DC28_01610 [Spirochaeta lutea]